MSSPSEGVRDLLVTAGLVVHSISASSTDWLVFFGVMGPSPDRAVGLYDTGGLPANPKWLLEEVTVQIRVRGKKDDYLATRVRAVAISDALLGLPSQTINGDRWVAVNHLSQVTYLGRDKDDRPEFTVNFKITIEPATGSNRLPL